MLHSEGVTLTTGRKLSSSLKGKKYKNIIIVMHEYMSDCMCTASNTFACILVYIMYVYQHNNVLYYLPHVNNTHMHSHTCTCSHTYTYTYMYTVTNIHTYTHALIHTHVHAHIHTHTHICTQLQTYIHAHMHLYTHMVQYHNIVMIKQI